MSASREISVKLSDWETRYILQALFREMALLKKINETSESEDEVADAGNDYMEISTLYDSLSENAVKTFGAQILNFAPEISGP